MSAPSLEHLEVRRPDGFGRLDEVALEPEAIEQKIDFPAETPEHREVERPLEDARNPRFDLGCAGLLVSIPAALSSLRYSTWLAHKPSPSSSSAPPPRRPGGGAAGNIAPLSTPSRCWLNSS